MRESQSSSLNCDWACSHLLTRCCSHFGADLIRGPCDNWLKVEVTRQVKRTANLSITLHSDANFITLRGLSSRGCGFSRLPFFVWWRSPSIRASKHKQSSIPAAEVLEKSKQLAGLPRRSWTRPSVDSTCQIACYAAENENNETYNGVILVNALAFPCVVSVLINWRIWSKNIFCSSHDHTDC